MTSSVDPSVEIAAIKARLGALPEPWFSGIPQGTVLPLDGFGRKAAYRDVEWGSVNPTAGERMLAAGEQGQPHNWSFQVHHVAESRDEAQALSTATDMSLLGWHPSANAGVIRPLYFTMYDEVDDAGALVEWIASRFYEVTLGQQPDFTLF